jgi:hypothetical protein
MDTPVNVLNLPYMQVPKLRDSYPYPSIVLKGMEFSDVHCLSGVLLY